MGEYSGSGSSSNAAELSGAISITDNAGGDVLSFINQEHSPGASATQTINKLNWLLLALGAGALGVAVWLYHRKK